MRSKDLVISRFPLGSTANDVTFVDTRHQNYEAENTPPNPGFRLHGLPSKEIDWGRVSVTESFDSFLTRLSSQAASTDAITRGVAIETYRGAQGDGPKIT